MAVNKIKHGRGISYQMTCKIDGKVVRKRFATSKLAWDAYAKLRQAHNDGSYIGPADLSMTVDSYAQEWLRDRRARPSTAAIYGGYYARHIKPVIGHLALSRVSKANISAMVTSCEEKGLAPSTTDAIYKIAAMIFRAAIDDNKLTRTPCRNIRLPEIPQRKLAFFTPEEVRRLLDVVPAKYYALLATCVGTGLRQAELLGLTIDNVDFDKKELHVDQQLLTPPGGRPTLTRLLKTKASRRTVPLPQMVIDALTTHLATHGVGPDGLIFTNPHGTGWRRSSFNLCVWKPALRKAGLPEAYGVHALRHTYASALIAQGQHARVIQARLGHASIVETMDTYGHLFPEAHEETARAIDTAFMVPTPPSPTPTPTPPALTLVKPLPEELAVPA